MGLCGLGLKPHASAIWQCWLRCQVPDPGEKGSEMPNKALPPGPRPCLQQDFFPQTRISVKVSEPRFALKFTHTWPVVAWAELREGCVLEKRDRRRFQLPLSPLFGGDRSLAFCCLFLLDYDGHHCEQTEHSALHILIFFPLKPSLLFLLMRIVSTKGWDNQVLFKERHLS